MSESHRPVLKIHLNTGARHQLPDESKTTTPTSATPGRLIIKSKRASIVTPSDIQAPPSQPLTTTKAGRLLKPSAKKREHDEYGDEEIPITMVEPPSKRKNTKQKQLNTRVKLTSRRPPVRPPGDGYDSEASDREVDPSIEEQIIFRMLPGEHCEYIRKAVEENKICSRKDGGVDFRIRWLGEDTRRAIVGVKGQLFVGVLLDLPTITEGMKSWDRKTFMKSADISQILLVWKAVTNEEEAKTTPLPPMVEAGFKWPHGLTPPMHDCVKRRFAKVISRKEIEDKEAEVERLLTADRASLGSRFEWIDDRRPKTPADEYMEDEDEDAEGDVDDTYFSEGGVEDAEGEDDHDDLEALFEAELELAANDTDLASPATNLGGITPVTAVGSTPTTHVQQSIEQEEEAESDEDEDEDDDDDDDEGEGSDNDEVNNFKEEIAELKTQLKLKEADLLKPHVANSAILKKKVQANIKSLKDEIRLKMSYINQEEDENED
ncbi:hypothetical protein BROUX41_004571 [Berkeleyomyces rouxiae]|uniref:uncharacterized protein n=1 Tax=Berkeleyomyces rouxiae TaxID=2035830 RepID=UPI003B778F38